MGRPARRRPLEHVIADPLRERYPHVLITGAGGQLGAALAETFPWADARTRDQLPINLRLDVLVPPPALVLHAAAYTWVDLAEQRPDGVDAVNDLGTKHVIESLQAPLVYYSTDYVFDGKKREPYVESDTPNPLSVYGRSKLAGERHVAEHGWIVRSSWLFGPTGRNFVRTMLSLGTERDEVAVVDDQRGCPTYVAHLAEATREIVTLPYSTYHVAADGDCTWAEFAEAIFQEAGLDCRVRRITTAEYGAAAQRPAYSVLRSEKPETPRLPHWRDGLRDCLNRMA